VTQKDPNKSPSSTNAPQEADGEKTTAQYNVDPNNPYSDESADKSGEKTVQSSSDLKEHEKAPDVWPLEADRVAIHDPLVNCLKLVAGHYGRRASVASLTAGLPIPKHGITPVLFERAAARANLNSFLVDRTLDSLAIAPNLPCIMVLEGNQACILWEVKQPKQKQTSGKKKITVHPDARFVVQFPETEDERQEMSLQDLSKIYTDYVFYVRPIARVDDRAGPAEIDNARNWFWSALWENKSIYTEVIAAAVMINLFALGRLRDFFTSATMAAIIDLPFIFFFIAIIAIIGGPIAFVPLAAIPIVVGVGFAMQKPLREAIKESMMESALKNALLFETISGLETVKVQAAEGHTQRRWEELTDKASRTSVKTRRVNSFALNFATFVQQLVSVFVVIVGVFLIKEAEISMGALIACVILSGRAMAPLAQIAGLLTRMHQSAESLRQLDELMKKDVERPSGKHFISMPSIKGKVEFRDVLFHYPEQTVPALNNLSFTLEPGDHVGVIGAVGSGKTTIERLMINLYQPESGSVQLDGTDVRQIDPGDLRRNVGAVQQSPQLFYGSVRENITMGHEMAPDRAVLRAAELAGVTEFLKESQAGLDTQVGERGEALSGGQRQAVAIARALLYDPPVLILDEPTASMDPASENRLRKRLHHVTEGRTTLLITHKGSMLTLVDKLILLDRGKLIAFGPKDEVIRKLQARQYGTAAEKTDV